MQKCDFAKVMTLKGQGYTAKYTISFIDLKNIDLDAKIFILSALVQKL